MRQIYIYLLLLFFLVNALFAQKKPHEQLQFQKYTVNEGLSQNIVEAILQDSEGFMWFGTQDGLNRFDGKNFKTFYFKIDDTSSLSNNYVKTIYEDLNGDLWIGTYGGGINKFDKRHSFQRYQHHPEDAQSISDNVANVVYQNTPEYLWIGTKEGLNKMHIRTGTFEHFFQEEGNKQSLTNNVIYSISKSTEAFKIWIGTKAGLNLFNLKTGRVEWSVLTFRGNSLDIRDLYLDDAGSLWIGTKGEGLLILDPHQQELRAIKLESTNLQAKYIRKIYPNDQGSIWVGTFGEGLFFLNNKEEVAFHFTKNNKQRSISNDRIVQIYQDATANFWIGTHGGGLNAFNLKAKKFNHYLPNIDRPNSLSNAAVNYIFEDKQGEIYVATDAGIDRVKDTTSGNLTFENIISSGSNSLDNRGWLLFEDSRDILWVGLWNYGLSRYDRKTGELASFTHDPNNPHSIASNFVESIVEDSLGNLWIGLIGGGLDYFDYQLKKFKHYKNDNSEENSLSNDRVHALTYDNDGDLWVGTDFGLDKYNPKIDGFEHYRYQSSDSLSINYNIVRVVFKDSFGSLWIGTGGGGISKILKSEGGKVYFKHYTTKDGLPNNNIAAIVEDQNHHLWITTYQGMVRFNPVTEEFRSYTTIDGLQGQEFIRRAAKVTSDGRIFVGGYNGLNVFDPNEIEDSNYEPAVRLIAVDIFNNNKERRRIESADVKLKLNHNDYLVSFEVSVTDYTSINKNKFAYRLEGFDNEWIDNANRRHFSYTNLPAGDYKLKVRATNSDGIWSKQMMEVELSVIPPFWETLWFQVLAVLLGLLFIFIYVRWRIYALRKSKDRLQTLVGKRTHEVELTNKKLIEEQLVVNEQKDQITSQHEEIVKQNKIIQQQNDELKLSNLQLEEVVDARTKELREANRELFASNHELDTFFYRAAHDLKGPVSTIQGLTYLALKEHPDKHMKLYLEKMDDTAKRMSGILFNLQKINKIKHTTAEATLFKITDLIEDALEDNIPDNADKDQFIQYQLKGITEQTEIYSDYVLLKIIFSNLFSNALKFSMPGEKTEVNIHFELNEESKQYRFIFEDFGVGIKKEYRDKIFDMFFIATDRNPGSGLGLYSVKMAVKKLGGSILVDPSFEQSSGFLLQLPFPTKKIEDSISIS